MWDFVFYCLIFLLLAAAGVVCTLLIRGYFDGTGVLARFLPSSTRRRVHVVERASIDNRRKLVLIQRDNVEHLIMTGGPVDVVIETGIGDHLPEPAKLRKSLENVVTAPVFSRQSRKLSRSAGDS